jgi:ribosomal protein S18 acetylase RimI-like enzyme
MSAELLKLERLTLRAWPALEEEEYDGWRLRAAQGYTGRANAVAPLVAGRLDLAVKIPHCEQWYAERGLPAKFRVTRFSQPGNLDATLAGRGFAQVEDVMVMTATLGGATPDSAVDGALVELTLEEWFAAKSAPVQRAILERIQPKHWLLGWRCNDELVGRVLGVVEDGWLGVFNLSVVPAQQRKGFGRALMRALTEHARQQGAQQTYLQVVAENAAAVGFYRGLGFREAYRYWYRTR